MSTNTACLTNTCLKDNLNNAILRKGNINKTAYGHSHIAGSNDIALLGQLLSRCQEIGTKPFTREFSAVPETVVEFYEAAPKLIRPDKNSQHHKCIHVLKGQELTRLYLENGLPPGHSAHKFCRACDHGNVDEPKTNLENLLYNKRVSEKWLMEATAFKEAERSGVLYQRETDKKPLTYETSCVGMPLPPSPMCWLKN
jgi:hypothetical protein